MHFSYSITALEMFQATTIRFGVRWWFVFLGFFLTIFVVPDFLSDGAPVTIDEARRLLPSMMLATGIALAAPVILFVRIWYQRRSNTLFFSDIDMTIDANGIRIHTRNENIIYAWSDFAGYRESRLIFMLIVGKSLGYIVPKRVFTPPEAKRFRAIINDKLICIG